jgi:hypothetical protein
LAAARFFTEDGTAVQGTALRENLAGQVETGDRARMGEAAPKDPVPSTTIASKRAERRRHRVYVTKNTEYHFRDGFCVAVRDRRSGDFLPGHLAIKRRIHGGVKFFPNGAIVPNPGDPRPGEALFFATDGRDLVTSPLERVERPLKTVVDAYPEAPLPAPSTRRR